MYNTLKKKVKRRLEMRFTTFLGLLCWTPIAVGFMNFYANMMSIEMRCFYFLFGYLIIYVVLEKYGEIQEKKRHKIKPKNLSTTEVFIQYLEWLDGRRTTDEMLHMFTDLDNQNRGTFYYPWWRRVLGYS